jgi:hypothetical protein
MKKRNAILLFAVILVIGCQKNEPDYYRELTDGFCIVADDKVVLNHNNVEYYDYSAHLIYLKDNKSFVADIQSVGNFKVFANKEQIYTGQTFPGYSSFLPSGPVIRSHPSGFGDYIVPLSFIQIIDKFGNALPDPREDERIVKALKKYNQFHAGLSCEIKSVQYLSSNNVKVVLLLKNNDSFNYYYLNPDKMSVNLFHYFTNGLYIRDFNNAKAYTHKIKPVQPVPWNSWQKDWLSIINGNESKTITITYDNFEEVTPGQYKANFQYPGLIYQVDKKDVQQDNGQIWLGELNMIKDLTIE